MNLDAQTLQPLKMAKMDCELQRKTQIYKIPRR